MSHEPIAKQSSLFLLAIAFLCVAGLWSPTELRACEPIIDQLPSQDPSSYWALSAVVGGLSQQNSGPTPVKGDQWLVEQIDGADVSRSRHQVFVLSDRVIVISRQTLKSAGGKAMNAAADIKVPMTVPGVASTNTDVHVRVWRTVIVDSGTTGEVQFGGLGGSQVLFSGGGTSLFDEQTTTHLSGDAFEFGVGADASMTTTQSGNAEIETIAEVQFCCGGSCPQPDFGPDGPPLFLEPTTCQPSEWTCGLGMHVSNYSGRVFTEVPILTTYAYGEVECDLRLRYNSGQESSFGVGQGWSHQFAKMISFHWETYPPDPSVLRLRSVLLRDGETGNLAFYPFVTQSILLDLNTNTISLPSNEAQTLRPSNELPQRLTIEPASGGYVLTKVQLGDGRRLEFKTAQAGFSPNGTSLVVDRIIDRRGRITRVIVDSTAFSVMLPSGRIIRFERDSSTGPYQRIIHPDNEVTTLTVSGGGRLEQVTDPLNQSVTFEYDGSYARLSREQLKNGNVLRAEYTILSGPHREIVELFASRPDPATGAVSEYRIARVQRNYRQLPGSLGEVLERHVNFTDGNGEEWLFLNGSNGYPRARINLSNNERREWDYDRYGVDRLVDERGELVVRQTRDSNGFVNSRKDAQDNQTVFYRERSDLPEKVTREVLPGGRTWKFEYYDRTTHGPTGDTGDLMAITDPSQYGETSPAKIQFEYTTRSASDNYSLISPWSINAEYDETDGLPGRIAAVGRTDRRGNLTVASFDSKGSPTEIVRHVENNHQLSTTFETDAMGRVTKRTVDGGLSGPDEITEWEYDEMGRVRFLKEGPSNAQLVTEFQYDPHGLLTQVIDAEGRATKLEYDESNRLQAQIEGYGVLNLRTEFRYDGNGNLVRKFAPEHFTSNAGHVTEGTT